MKYTINLLPKPEETVVDKAVYFSFHYLRYILVMTQFVVVCVFFYRFRVDQEIVDLKDNITHKQEIINATRSMLEEVKDIDTQLTRTSNIISEQDTMNLMFSYILAIKPPSVTFNQMKVSSDAIHVVGLAEDVQSVKIFYDSLTADERFETILFNDIKREEEGYTFVFTLQNFK